MVLVDLVLRAWWDICGEGAAVASLSRLVNPPLSSFFSSFSPFPFSGCLLAIAPAVSLVGCIVWLLYLYSGATAYFVWIGVTLELAANDMLKSMGAQAISDPDSFSKVSLLSTSDYTTLFVMLLFMLLKTR